MYDNNVIISNLRTINPKYRFNEHYLFKYVNFIRKFENIGIKFETHHILPRNYFPTLVKDRLNLCKLSPRAHFIAHILLSKAVPSSMGLIYAAYMMSKRSKFRYKNCERLKEEFKNKCSKRTKSIVVDGSHPSTLRSKYKTHQWLGENNPVHLQIKNGTHCSTNPNSWINTCGKLGLTHNQKSKPWKNTGASYASKMGWKFCDLIFKEWSKDTNIKGQRLRNLCNKCLDLKSTHNFELTNKICNKMIEYFKSGYDPNLDLEFLEYKNTT